VVLGVDGLDDDPMLYDAGLVTRVGDDVVRNGEAFVAVAPTENREDPSVGE
jgi:hypothetical protein